MQRLNVPIATLLERAQESRAKLVADHQQAVIDYPAKVEAFEGAVVMALHHALDQAIAGKVPKVGYNGVVEVRPKKRLPDTPSKPVLNTSKIDRDIRLLESTSQETTVVSTDSNWSCYL